MTWLGRRAATLADLQDARWCNIPSLSQVNLVNPTNYNISSVGVVYLSVEVLLSRIKQGKPSVWKLTIRPKRRQIDPDKGGVQVLCMLHRMTLSVIYISVVFLLSPRPLTFSASPQDHNPHQDCTGHLHGGRPVP